MRENTPINNGNMANNGNVTPCITLTDIQIKALGLIKSEAKHILLYGGSRSGKTHLLVIVIIVRALLYPGSCHLICRYRAKHAKSSVLHQTLLPMLNKAIGPGAYTYRAVTTAHSRLAKVTPGCRNQFLYDCNPTTPQHWAHIEFIQKKAFLSGEDLEDPQLYASLLMNPADYLTSILDKLPNKQRARFRDGAWIIPEGAIYEKFDQSMILKEADLPEQFDRFS